MELVVNKAKETREKKSEAQEGKVPRLMYLANIWSNIVCLLFFKLTILEPLFSFCIRETRPPAMWEHLGDILTGDSRGNS